MSVCVCEGLCINFARNFHDAGKMIEIALNARKAQNIYLLISRNIEVTGSATSLSKVILLAFG